MSCTVTCISVDGVTRQALARGNPPKKPSTWRAKAWLILPSGVKQTHSSTVRGETVHTLIPIVGALIDSLIADAGNQVTSAGWSASTH